MRAQRVLPIVSLITGVVFCCLGSFFISAYVVEAVWATAGQPDRSPLFWYLPILFIGFFICAVGAGICAWGIGRLRKTGRRNI